jgi:hypothetical protein
MKKNFLKEFEKFEKNTRIQVEEMQKVSGGTCIFYSSCSYGDCDTDDCTLTGGGWDADTPGGGGNPSS